MAEETKYKRILDSVHGYIRIPEVVCDEIIDTIQFQRLRRIEQMSIRTLFPCARHDRFTHSLGVYHLGCKIVEAISDTKEANEFPPDIKEKVFESYKLACLLHDVGHSPFSHTFEGFFEQFDNLNKLLKELINTDSFNDDFTEYRMNAKPHEKMSAYIAIRVYGETLERLGADKELVTRMITGCTYQDKTNHSFENAFIDLLHGDIIDADRLDYVKRDTWSAGYYSANVDVERLISGIVIHKDDKGIWQVCYSPKSINEIHAVLSVKTFQSDNAVNHHIVVLEQYILKEAMKSAAVHALKKTAQNSEDRKNALQELCNVKTFIEEVPGNPLLYPEDGDFVSLIKKVKRESNDIYAEQWLSRKYQYIPLWKSKAELYAIFPRLIDSDMQSKYCLFTDKCKELISKELKINKSEVVILKANSTNSMPDAQKVNFLIKDNILPYKKVFFSQEDATDVLSEQFSFVYIPKNYENKVESLLDKMKSELMMFFKNNEIYKYMNKYGNVHATESPKQDIISKLKLPIESSKIFTRSKNIDWESIRKNSSFNRDENEVKVEPDYGTLFENDEPSKLITDIAMSLTTNNLGMYPTTVIDILNKKYNNKTWTLQDFNTATDDIYTQFALNGNPELADALAFAYSKPIGLTSLTENSDNKKKKAKKKKVKNNKNKNK